MIKKISLCLIVKNEAASLAKFLEHVYPFVDEIILGDTGSTDDTVKIASEFPKVEVLHIGWEDDFSLARNTVLQKATGSWILVLDVDEFISLPHLVYLKKIASSYVSKACVLPIRHYINDVSRPGFVFSKANNDLSRGALGYVETTKISFFENDSRIRYSGLIHETVQESLKNIGEVPVKEEVVIHHYGYLNTNANTALGEAKYNYYLSLGKKQIAATPKEPKPYFDTALVYLNNGDYKNSMLFLQKALDINPDYLDAIHNKGVVSFLAGDYQSAYDLFLRLSHTDYDKRSSLDSLGRVCMKLHKYEQAVDFFKQAIALDPNNIYAYYNLAVILQAQENYSEAVSFFAKAISLNPNFMNAYLGSGMCFLKMGKLDESLSMFLKISKDVPVYIEAQYHAGFAYQQQQKYKEAVSCYKEVLSADDNINALYNIAICFESLEQKQDALSSYQKLLSLKPELEKDIAPKIDSLQP